MTLKIGRMKARVSGVSPAARGKSHRVCGRAFTLLEVILTLTLVAMLAAVAAVTVGAGGSRRQFAAAVGRFGTMFRMARAEAANHGCRFMVSFESDSTDPSHAVRVLWESDHLAQPGVFTDYVSSTWTSLLPRDDVRVMRCGLVGPSAYRTLADEMAGSDDDEDALENITFYPDGSSDSAVIELAPADETDGQRAAIYIDGVNATIRTWADLSVDELETNRAEIERGLYEPQCDEYGNDE